MARIAASQSAKQSYSIDTDKEASDKQPSTRRQQERSEAAVVQRFEDTNSRSSADSNSMSKKREAPSRDQKEGSRKREAPSRDQKEGSRDDEIDACVQSELTLVGRSPMGFPGREQLANPCGVTHDRGGACTLSTVDTAVPVSPSGELRPANCRPGRHSCYGDATARPATPATNDTDGGDESRSVQLCVARIVVEPSSNASLYRTQRWTSRTGRG